MPLPSRRLSLSGATSSMARTLYVTPDDASPALTGFVVYLPDDVFLIAAFWGAYYTLATAENWQEVGTLTPTEAAELFADASDLTHPLTEA